MPGLFDSNMFVDVLFSHADYNGYKEPIDYFRPPCALRPIAIHTYI